MNDSSVAAMKKFRIYFKASCNTCSTYTKYVLYFLEHCRRRPPSREHILLSRYVIILSHELPRMNRVLLLIHNFFQCFTSRKSRHIHCFDLHFLSRLGVPSSPGSTVRDFKGTKAYKWNLVTIFQGLMF